jgi:hypothetical protein
MSMWVSLCVHVPADNVWTKVWNGMLTMSFKTIWPVNAPSHTIPVKSILILCSHVSLGLPDIFLWRFWTTAWS